MGKSATLNTSGGNTTLTVTFTYANAKFTELAGIAAKANGIPLATLQAMTAQQQADWLMNNALLHSLKRWANEQKRQDAVENITPYDFDSTSGG